MSKNLFLLSFKIWLGVNLSNFFNDLSSAFPTLAIVSFTFLCAPPIGSEIISSTTLSFDKSTAVSLSASAAYFILSEFFHKIEAQPSGEITE